MNEKILQKIKLLSQEQIHEELVKREQDVDLAIINAIHKKAENICYSRSECEMLDISYCEIRGTDFEKAKLAAWYESEQ